ncbi:MAG: response regulator transcription factor [Anaeroplasmataceae bacterium]
MINVLIVDDEINILNLIKIRLKQYNYNCFTANNGSEALNLLYKNQISLIITDIMMPVLNGYEFIKTIREDGYNTPVIMLSAKGSIIDKKIGFELGIDDYIVKPFDFDELIFRMNAVLKRYNIKLDNKIVINNLIIDFNTLTIKDDKHELTLPKKEFQLLYKLISYPEKSFTKSQLFEEFWGYDTNTEEDIVKVYISKIRSQIQVFDSIDIETIRGIGYRGIKNEK